MNPEESRQPRVSIIIPFYNGVKYTMDCINSIYQTLPKFPIEIIACGVGNDGIIGLLSDYEVRFPNFKLIQNTTEHTHFAVNCNLGAKHALGDFLCFLNNDIILTPGWLDQLMNVYARLLKAPAEERPCPPPAAIGPCSNYVMQHQAIQLPQDFKLSDLYNFSVEINQKNRGQWFYASIISGFCMVVDRVVFEGLNGFDEDFFNGNEDVDFCIRLNDAGYSCIVDRSTFIYHYGSKTLKTYEEELGKLEGGTVNRVQVVKKYYGDAATEKKVSGNVRLKCSKEQLEAWLKRHNDLFDVINIVDDDSGWPMGDYLKENWPKVVYLNMPGKIEVVQRRMLYLLSLEQGMDWMCVLDHDEFFEEKVDRAYLQRVLNLPIPGCVSFVARWIHLWNTPETYHVKYPPSLGIILRKVQPNLAYVGGAPGTSLHCSRIPETPVVGSAPTNIKVLHYGYLDRQLRERKRTYYEDRDPNPIPMLVGGTTYRHLTDETEIVMSQWLGSYPYTLSLTAMAENESEHQIQMLLEQVGSLMDEIVFRVPPESPRIPLLKRWGANVIEKTWNDDYSSMRNLLLDTAKSNYALILDMDENLQDPMELIRLIELQPTAVMFTVQNIQPHGRPPAMTEVMRLLENRPDIRFSGVIHETIEDSMAKLKDKVILRAGGMIIHLGFLIPKLPEKLKKYVKMNKKAMHNNPKDPKPYFNLALHYLEEGEIQAAVDYLLKSISLHPKFTLAKLELAKVYSRFAHALLTSCLDDIPENHPLRKPTMQFTQIISNVIPPKEPILFPPLIDLSPKSPKIEQINARQTPRIPEVLSSFEPIPERNAS